MTTRQTYIAALEDVESLAFRYRRAVMDEQRGLVSVAECSKVGRELDAAMNASCAARERCYAGPMGVPGGTYQKG